VIDQANKESIPDGVLLMAGGNAPRARVIWIKLRLKQEFPMNYAEARTPWKTPDITPNSPDGAPPFPSAPAGQSPWAQFLAPRRSYVTALGNAVGKSRDA